MSLRINNAKNFAGKNYMVTDDVDKVIQSIKLDNLQKGSGEALDTMPVDWKLTYGKAEKGTEQIFTDLNPIKKYVDSKSGAATTVVAKGDGVTVTPSQKEDGSTTYTVAADADGLTIGINTVSKKLESLLTLKKLDKANDGYAASYQLQNGKGTKIGAQIDIVKDQFLKSGSVVWGKDPINAPVDSVETGDGDGYKETKGGAWQYAFVRLEMHTAKDGAAGSKTSTIFIPAQEMFQSYVAGFGIDSDELAKNNLTVVVDNTDQADKIFVSSGVQSSVLSVTKNGVKATGIQAAIDLAAGDVYSKASAGVTDVSSKLIAHKGSVDGIISSTYANVNTRLGEAVTALNGKVSSVNALVSSVNSNVSDFKDTVVTAFDTFETNVETGLKNVIDEANLKIDSTVANVNKGVTDFKGTVEKQFTNVEAAVKGSFEKTKAAIDTVKGKVDTALTGVMQVKETAPVKPTHTASDGEVQSVVSVTVEGADHIIAVYGNEGGVKEEIFPEIVNNGDNSYRIFADYGQKAANADEWIVKYAAAHEEMVAVETSDVKFVAVDNVVAFTAGSAVELEASKNAVESAPDTPYVSVDVPAWENAIITTEVLGDATIKTAEVTQTSVAELGYRKPVAKV